LQLARSPYGLQLKDAKGTIFLGLSGNQMNVSRAAWRWIAIASGMLSAIGTASPEHTARQDRKLQAEFSNHNISSRIERVRSRLSLENGATPSLLRSRIAQWFNFNNFRKPSPNLLSPQPPLFPKSPGGPTVGPVPSGPPPPISGLPGGPQQPVSPGPPGGVLEPVPPWRNF
jgi:hypothetical protein